MSKPEKVTLQHKNTPLLDDLNFIQVLEDWKKAKKLKELATASEEALRNSLAAIVSAVGANAVEYISAEGKLWTVISVSAGSGFKSDRKKLLTAMGKIGKLDSATVKEILEASLIPTDRKAHGKVLQPGEKEEED